MADAVDVLLGYVRIKGKSECLKKYEVRAKNVDCYNFIKIEYNFCCRTF